MREAAGRFGTDGAGDKITDPVIRGLLGLVRSAACPGDQLRLRRFWHRRHRGSPIEETAAPIAVSNSPSRSYP
jgi:hypothetical protein